MQTTTCSPLECEETSWSVSLPSGLFIICFAVIEEELEEEGPDHEEDDEEMEDDLDLDENQDDAEGI